VCVCVCVVCVCVCVARTCIENTFHEARERIAFCCDLEDKKKCASIA